MILENSEEIYKALIKVNNIGKKISLTSNYILSNGIIFGYSKQTMSLTEANPISIGFIDNSLYKKLNGIGDKIGLLIDGNLLYEYSNKYDFDSIDIDQYGMNINYIYYAVDDNAYIENFKQILKNKKFKESEIEKAEISGFTSDMDMYDLLLKYKKEVSPSLEKTIISIQCKFATCDNFMYKYSEKIIDMLLNSECLYEEDEIDRNILDLILSNKQPIIRKLYLNNDKKLKVRLMKSLFNPIASKNNAGIYIYKNNHDYIMSIKIELSGVVLFNIYKVLDY